MTSLLRERITIGTERRLVHTSMAALRALSRVPKLMLPFKTGNANI